MDYNGFLTKIRQIKETGYVATHRPGDTGVGKTLEDLLGIEENNIDGPDFEIYELKSARKQSSSMLTLFTKVPQPMGANTMLLSSFGYPERKKPKSKSTAQEPLAPRVIVAQQEFPRAPSDNELHVTVEFGRENSVGLQLGMQSNKLVVENSKGIPAYYEQEYLKEAFEKKYGHKMIYVLAENRKSRTRPEEFWYTGARLLSGFSFAGFLSLVRERVIKLDLRIGHYPDGRTHDHGTGFRVLPKELPRCFASVERIL